MTCSSVVIERPTSFQLNHLQAHYGRVGGGMAVKEASEMLRERIAINCDLLEKLLGYKRPYDDSTWEVS